VNVVSIVVGHIHPYFREVFMSKEQTSEWSTTLATYRTQSQAFGQNSGFIPARNQVVARSFFQPVLLPMG
jgi:hypothetical protein